jgi:uncharacterized RDD family membrane protein YckC
MEDDVADPTVIRRLAAFTIDAGLVLVVSVALMMAWVIHVVGRTPVTALDWDRAMSTIGDLTLVQYIPLIAYVVWSWTPLSGRRSLGKRALGLRVVRG